MMAKAGALRQLFQYDDLDRVEAHVRTCLQQGDSAGAIAWMEQAVALQQQHFGTANAATQDAIVELATHCNQLATQCIQQQELNRARKYLNKADALCKMLAGQQRKSATAGLTPAARFVRVAVWKTMGCYLHQIGEFRSAFSYLSKVRVALHDTQTLDDGDVGAAAAIDEIEVVLNMCAALSSQGKHQQALKHAKEALVLAQEQRIQTRCIRDDSNANANERVATLTRKLTMFVVVAYHNVGVELEFLNEHAQCLSSYRKALHVAEMELTAESEECVATKEMMARALAAAEAAIERKNLTEVYAHHNTVPSMAKSDQFLLNHPRKQPAKQRSTQAKHTFASSRLNPKQKASSKREYKSCDPGDSNQPHEAKENEPAKEKNDQHTTSLRSLNKSVREDEHKQLEEDEEEAGEGGEAPQRDQLTEQQEDLPPLPELASLDEELPATVTIAVLPLRAESEETQSMEAREISLLLVSPRPVEKEDNEDEDDGDVDSVVQAVINEVIERIEEEQNDE